jgi:hypothetical protein
VAQAVEHLLYKCKALSTNSNPTKNKKDLKAIKKFKNRMYCLPVTQEEKENLHSKRKKAKANGRKETW